jgi:germination protein M
MKPTSHLLVLALVAVVALVAACNGSTGGLGSVPSVAPTPSAEATGPDLTPAPSDGVEPSAEPSDAPDSNATPVPTATPAASPAGTMIVRNYFFIGVEPGSAGLVPVLRTVPKTTAVATAAMKALLAGPAPIEGESFGPATAIPEGTRLLGLTVKNGVATANLSTEFDSGTGKESMQDRLAQIVYTLTQFTTIKSVVFQIEGETVTVFGGEGIVLDGPQTRADYYDQLPSIFVDRPAYGAAFASGGHVAGNANVFEATFRVAIIDASGKTLVDRQVMAACGTGCRGKFDVTIQYKVSKGQWGTLHAYNPSAKDGTPEAIRDYPVWLTPGA